MDLRSLPPGYRFVPKEKELVEFYLLPRARGLPDRFPGVDITEEDTAASTQPWKLFERHKRSDDDEPYFWVYGNDARAGALQNRSVDGGFRWKCEKTVPGVLNVGGDRIKWTKRVLYLQRGDNRSLGWVMHEYAIDEPHCASIKTCRISSGYGQKRKRIPEGCDDNDDREPQTQSALVVAAQPLDYSSTAREFGQKPEQPDNGEDCQDGSASRRTSGSR